MSRRRVLAKDDVEVGIRFRVMNSSLLVEPLDHPRGMRHGGTVVQNTYFEPSDSRRMISIRWPDHGFAESWHPRTVRALAQVRRALTTFATRCGSTLSTTNPISARRA